MRKWGCPEGGTEEAKPAESQRGTGVCGGCLWERQSSEGVLNFNFLKAEWLLPLQWLNRGFGGKILILFLLYWHLLSRKMRVLKNKKTAQLPCFTDITPMT